MIYNEIETIDGVKGEWRTVTKPSEVTVGQRVRYECYDFDDKHGYTNNRFISEKNEDETCSTWDGVRPRSCTDFLFKARFWTNIQAFFTLPVRAEKRKVAKVRIIQLDGCSSHYFVTYPMGVYCGKTYATKKSAIRGAQRFCSAIGYECEIQKEAK